MIIINDVNQGLDKPKVWLLIETLFQEVVALTLPYSELKEKSWVYGLQGEYGHKAET